MSQPIASAEKWWRTHARTNLRQRPPQAFIDTFGQWDDDFAQGYWWMLTSGG